jgi:hypothetical protein
MIGLDKRHVAGGSGDVDVGVGAAAEYELPLHQLGSDDDDDDNDVKATGVVSRGHSLDTGSENRRRLL